MFVTLPKAVMDGNIVPSVILVIFFGTLILIIFFLLKFIVSRIKLAVLKIKIAMQKKKQDDTEAEIKRDWYQFIKHRQNQLRQMRKYARQRLVQEEPYFWYSYRAIKILILISIFILIGVILADKVRYTFYALSIFFIVVSRGILVGIKVNLKKQRISQEYLRHEDCKGASTVYTEEELVKIIRRQRIMRSALSGLALLLLIVGLFLLLGLALADLENLLNSIFQ